MPQQFVQQGQTEPDYGQLLVQTNAAAERQHKEQRRKAAQAALLQQMVNRGEIKLDKGDSVKVGDNKMEFGTGKAKGRFESAFAPVKSDLTRDNQNTSKQKLVADMGTLSRETTYETLKAHLNANQGQTERMADATAVLDKIRTDYTDNDAGVLAKRILGNEGQGVVSPTELKTATDAANALTEPSTTQPTPSTTQPTPSTTQPTTTSTPATPTKESISNRKAATVKEDARIRSELSADVTPFTVETKGENLYKTTTTTGANFLDEIQETLPSLRRNAQLEAIAAMFGGGDQKAPGNYDALAKKRESDLTEYNNRLEKAGTSETLSGGLTQVDVKGGNVKASAKEAATQGQTFNISMGNVKNTGGNQNEHINKLQVPDASGQDTTLNFNDKGVLVQDADNIAIQIPGRTQINSGADLTKTMRSKLNPNGAYASWKVLQDSPEGQNPSIITLKRPDGKAIRLVHDPDVLHSGGLVGWKAQLDAGIEQAEAQYWLNLTANKGLTGTQKQVATKPENE